MRKNILRIGALAMAAGVILGAFGAHSLKEIISPAKLITFETGVRYHFIHALAILFIGVLLYSRKTKFMHVSAWLFGAGIICFSGSLYLLALNDVLNLPTALLGPITPIGGLLFIAGWITFFFSTFKENDRYRSKKGEV